MWYKDKGRYNIKYADFFHIPLRLAITEKNFLMIINAKHHFSLQMNTYNSNGYLEYFIMQQDWKKEIEEGEEYIYMAFKH